jgi:hypothetical protein
MTTIVALNTSPMYNKACPSTTNNAVTARGVAVAAQGSVASVRRHDMNAKTAILAWCRLNAIASMVTREKAPRFRIGERATKSWSIMGHSPVR